MRARLHGQAQKLDAINLRAPLVAKIIGNAVVRAFGNEGDVVVRSGKPHLQDMVFVRKADFEHVAHAGNPVRRKEHGLGGMDEMHFVVVGTILADARERNAHAGYEAFLAGGLCDERLRAAVRAKRQAKRRVLDDNLASGGAKRESRRHGGHCCLISHGVNIIANRLPETTLKCLA